MKVSCIIKFVGESHSIDMLKRNFKNLNEKVLSKINTWHCFEKNVISFKHQFHKMVKHSQTIRRQKSSACPLPNETKSASGFCNSLPLKQGAFPVDLLQNFILFKNGSRFEFSLRLVRHVLMLKRFFFFDASISNVYAFKCLGRKNSNGPFKRICSGVMKNETTWRMVPLIRIPFKQSFFACKDAASSGDMQILSH